MGTINELVNDALGAWVELTGVDLDRHSWSTKDFDDWGAHTLAEHTKELNASRELDPTGLTTFMMLRGLVDGYLKAIKFSAYSLIMEPDSTAQALRKMWRMREMVEEPEVVDLIHGFEEKLRTAAAGYGLVGEDATKRMESLLADRYDLGQLRRDALVSMQQLECHQFTQGQADPAPLRVNGEVFEFWNINSVLLAMKGQRLSGVTLCLIRDPVETFASFFVLAIRNGSTLTILTDRAKTPHPDFWKTTRRPDRLFERRAAKHWFPYQLLDLNRDEESQRLYENVRTSLVPYDAKGVVIAKLGDLRAETLVWLTLLFDLILDRFWHQDFKTEKLSYTGEMVRVPDALVGANSALVREGHYQPLILPPLTPADVTTEATAEQWVQPCTGGHHWMVERYGDRVPESLFNVLGPQEAAQLAQSTIGGDLLPVPEHHDFFREGKPMEISALSPMAFGDAQALDQDRVWSARVNQMRAISRLAEEEYYRERDNIRQWYLKRVKSKVEMVLDAAAHGQLTLPSNRRSHHSNDEEVGEDDSVLHQHVGTGFCSDGGWWHARVSLIGGMSAKHDYLCYEEESIATVFTHIFVTCAEAIAIVTGTALDKLPAVLQHYRHGVRWYGHNHLLNRLDPEDWALRNPWNNENFNIAIASSRSAMNARRKRLGLPRRKWEDLKARKDEG